MSVDAEQRIERLKQKYGTKAIENGMRLRPHDFLDEVERKSAWNGFQKHDICYRLIQGVAVWVVFPIALFINSRMKKDS